jgi:hypothetical protein
VDPTKVAERAGNSVEVRLSRYAKFFGEGDDQEEIKN